MFEYTFVPDGKTRRPLFVLIACGLETVLLAIIVLIPLFFVETLPVRGLISGLMLAPVPSAPVPPPPPIVATAPVRRTTPPKMFNANALVAPVVVPKAVAIITDEPVLEAAVAGGIPGGIPGIPSAGNSGTGFYSSAIPLAPPPPPMKTAPAAAPQPPAAPRQVTVGGDVEAAMLLEMTPPTYPPLARQAHIRGSVVLRAVIGTDGRVKNLTVVSGHPMLVEAALAAVKKWTYRPTILDGSPVEVHTDIQVRFGLTAAT